MSLKTSKPKSLYKKKEFDGAVAARSLMCRTTSTKLNEAIDPSRTQTVVLSSHPYEPSTILLAVTRHESDQNLETNRSFLAAGLFAQLAD
ncbi:MAG: hypothetical protein KME27_10150 [Lyngbya sp. HA4199-MV5]|nr:hypothetical protein [Lyngbya sp. HA4199-MV5]